MGENGSSRREQNVARRSKPIQPSAYPPISETGSGAHPRSVSFWREFDPLCALLCDIADLRAK